MHGCVLFNNLDWKFVLFNYGCTLINTDLNDICIYFTQLDIRRLFQVSLSLMVDVELHLLISLASCLLFCYYIPVCYELDTCSRFCLY